MLVPQLDPARAESPDGPWLHQAHATVKTTNSSSLKPSQVVRRALTDRLDGAVNRTVRAVAMSTGRVRADVTGEAARVHRPRASADPSPSASNGSRAASPFFADPSGTASKLGIDRDLRTRPRPCRQVIIDDRTRGRTSLHSMFFLSDRVGGEISAQVPPSARGAILQRRDSSSISLGNRQPESGALTRWRW